MLAQNLRQIGLGFQQYRLTLAELVSNDGIADRNGPEHCGNNRLQLGVFIFEASEPGGKLWETFEGNHYAARTAEITHALQSLKRKKRYPWQDQHRVFHLLDHQLAVRESRSFHQYVIIHEVEVESVAYD